MDPVTMHHPAMTGRLCVIAAVAISATKASYQAPLGAWPPEVGGCLPGNATCLPTWRPTWNMYRSTVLYICNTSGFHDPKFAVQFGIVVYDWSNGKAIWANQHPMDSQSLITKQAEMVLSEEPGVTGEAPRVWAYRNTIKALNWYKSVREKLDDPKYASWFIKFKDYKGPKSNNSYHVPACDWAPPNPKCSGFYHDQEQTPEHPGADPDVYRPDGRCIEQCDCGPTNPCGEYIFDHRGGEVEGRTFRDWFIDEYMVTDETLLHKNSKTGERQPINLGWLDDAMGLNGPSEEDPHYIEDTGAAPEDMQSQVDAYKESMTQLTRKVVAMGGFYWQLMITKDPRLPGLPPSQCKQVLREECAPKPKSWLRMKMFRIQCKPVPTAENFTQFTAEFLLTRGPYSLIGYSWCGCANKQEERPRAKEWNEDFGEPETGAPCAETGNDTGVFERRWSKALVRWDCATGNGQIVPVSPVVV